MAQMYSTGTGVFVARRGNPLLIVSKDPTRALAVLISQGHSAPVARAVAFGGALTSERAQALGRAVGLLQ